MEITEVAPFHRKCHYIICEIYIPCFCGDRCTQRANTKLDIVYFETSSPLRSLRSLRSLQLLNGEEFSKYTLSYTWDNLKNIFVFLTRLYKKENGQSVGKIFFFFLEEGK